MILYQKAQGKKLCCMTRGGWEGWTKSRISFLMKYFCVFWLFLFSVKISVIFKESKEKFKKIILQIGRNKVLLYF